MDELAGRPKGALKGIAAAVCVALAAALTACTSAPKPSPAPPRALGFSASGLDGGGFVNVVAFDPAVPGLVLAGGDVSGILRSTDYGRSWSAANAGLHGLAELKVASILFAPSGEAYAAVGDGKQGGVLVSMDGGIDWKLRSDVPVFSGGNNTGTPLPVPHPRSTGTLLALDPGRGLLYAATFDSGVMRSADDGSTWKTLGLGGEFLRGIAMDPSHPDVVYAASYGNGVFQTMTANTTGIFEPLPNSPRTVEELAIVGGIVFAAAGAEGIYSSADSGASWTQLPPTGATWESITGYSACGATVLYAGSAQGGPGSLLRSTNGGASWIPVGVGAGVHTQVGGPGGATWWLASEPRFMLGGALYTASQIAVEAQVSSTAACTPASVLVAGRSGVWGSNDGGNQWYPMVSGMGVTIVHAAAVDQSAPADVYAAAADWTLLSSGDAGATFSHWSGAMGTGFSLAEDASTQPATVYVGTGTPASGGDGDVFAGSSSRPWSSLGLVSAVNGNVLALAARTIDGRAVVLAAVDGGGVWRKDGSSSWTRTDVPALSSPGAVGGVSLSWGTGSTVFLFDRSTGLWRSDDAGATWSIVWSKRSTPAFTGWVTTDPSTPGRIYVSVGDQGLYRLDDSGSGSVEGGQIHPERLQGIEHPGPVAVTASGVVYVCDLAAAGAPADLKVSTDGGGQWQSVGDAKYRATAIFPLGLSIAPGGLLYLSLDGNGMLIGRVPK